MVEFEQRLRKSGVPQGAIEALTYLFGEVLDGRSESTTDGVARALGRPATRFDEYIQRNRQAFAEVA